MPSSAFTVTGISMTVFSFLKFDKIFGVNVYFTSCSGTFQDGSFRDLGLLVMGRFVMGHFVIWAVW
jgi:hypothetical protein